jgi:NAD(P)-dependent dehydrogenase (short-subunit alcohol dehydrogenase family)
MNAVALVTGASRGIGRGIATELARAGFDVVLNYVQNAAAAAEAVAESVAAAAVAGRQTRAVAVQADIALAEDRERLLAQTRAEFGRLDVLVNNAGVAPAVRADLLETGEASFDRVMAVNVKGPFFLTQAAARWMVEQAVAEAAGETGRSVTGSSRKIVTVTSISAYTASVNRGEYCMAKAALAMLTPLFATRLAEHGIQVFEIRPGLVATDMTAPVREKYDRWLADGLTPIRRWGTPADVGKAVAAIAGDGFPFSTGEVVNVDGGFHLRRL